MSRVAKVCLPDKASSFLAQRFAAIGALKVLPSTGSALKVRLDVVAQETAAVRRNEVAAILYSESETDWKRSAIC